jgi:hypothetical protein
MDELMDFIVSGESAEASDKIKEIIFAKAAERIDAARPVVANVMFGNGTYEDYDEYFNGNEVGEE